MTVIGIASDTDAGEVGNRGGGQPYLPWTQHYQSGMTVPVRSSGDPTALLDSAHAGSAWCRPRSAGRWLPKPLPRSAAAAASCSRLAGERRGFSGGWRSRWRWPGCTARSTQLVLRRTRELGIPHGARRRPVRLLRMVLLDGVRPVLVGLAIGLGCGVVLRLGFRPLFIRMLPAFDPLIVGIVPAAFIAAALLAAYLPARRAAVSTRMWRCDTSDSRALSHLSRFPARNRSRSRSAASCWALRPTRERIRTSRRVVARRDDGTG